MPVIDNGVEFDNGNTSSDLPIELESACGLTYHLGEVVSSAGWRRWCPEPRQRTPVGLAASFEIIG